MKKRSILIIGFAVCTLLLAFSTAFGQESISAKDWTQVVEQIGAKGRVNWSGGYVEATGIGAPPEKYYGKPQARPMALRAAQVDAYRNLLEVVQGVRVDSETEVRDFTTASDTIRAKVEGLVKGAQIVKRDYLSDGTVEVTLRMPLYGEFANTILPLPKPTKPEEPPVAPAAPVEPVTPAGPQVVSPPPAPAAEVYTGLVVDARGVQLRPTMKPRIIDESGKEVYGYMMVDQNYANQQGISSYSKDLTAAQNNPRVTNNPLTVKALRAEGPTKGDVVISTADASKIEGAAENLSFLKKCRVMIVLD
ncbi:MAG TPA: LPP20 family lipoprotein [Syntrophales bacterium]|nr:LPP20 family lipoprotein [Syntrophales bacterium]HRT71187.1 LPP20 family lipoprotein [Syntrophales bacterium]